MCRIAGIVSGHSRPEVNREKVSLMCAALQHGGPDDGGIFQAPDNQVVFGHRRLSVIDLSSKGHQPMADVHQRVWITFNGEIYNYPEIKTELKKQGAVFFSDTDTEVIIHAFFFWGEHAFPRLRGMFAFALYDIAASQVFLVRDAMGVKPLYYQINDGELIFSSEVKAMKAALVANTADEDWKVRFLAFGHIPEPFTTYKNVLSLPKGNFLRWNTATHQHRIQSYVHKPLITAISNEIIARKEIYNGLKIAVKRNLLADAPIGVFLSGGVDSSLITLLANEEKKNGLKTISIYFDEKNYDERIYQRTLSDEINGQKFSHLVRQQEFELYFHQIMADMDMPTTDGINTWFISKYAHEDGLKAVLSGIGADELFGGYPSFNRIEYLRLLRKLPSSFFKATRYIAADRYKKISFLKHDHVWADYLFLRGLFAPVDIARLLDADIKQINDILFCSSDLNIKQRAYNKEQAAWFEENVYMQNQLLRDTDVMSMSHGLEARVPFLDEDFQQMVKSITPLVRFNKKPKQLLIDSFKDYLPESIWNRPKMGFTFPLQIWMRDFDEISNEHLYRNKFSKQVIKKFKNGQMHWSKAFALYHLQMHG
jgi:asparagine synthase (glutamine-hydrolysing)